MAKMLPKEIWVNVTSNAEKKVFEWFKNAPNTQDWVVLHSFGLSQHIKQVRGEIDFLVLAPQLGVFCLEVKGGGIVRRDGLWFSIDYNNHEHKLKRSPFEQANSALESLMQLLIDRHGFIEETGVLRNFGVMFPDTLYDYEDLEISKEQIFDQKYKDDVTGYIKRLSKHTGETLKSKGTYRPFPSIENVKNLMKLLRGDFEFVISLNQRIKTTEEQLIALTEQQYECLDNLSNVSKCLITGLAGTGKTLLAIQKTKEEFYKGKKVALFCYNISLSKWLKLFFEKELNHSKNIYIGSFIDYMEEIVSKKGNIFSNAEKNDVYYKETLPDKCLEVLMDSPEFFDFLIVDEAQDLFRDTFVDIWDFILRGGLKDGRFYLFGDFVMQTIFNKGLMLSNVNDKLNQYGHFTHFNLTKNCRNAQTILDEINVFVPHEDNKALRKTSIPIPIEYISYTSIENQKEKLEATLDKLLQSGLEPKQITILSTRKRENSVVSLVTKYKIIDYQVDDINKITFSTIHAFKGLENCTIILTDFNEWYKKLFYVGASRARIILYVLESINARKARKEYQNRNSNMK